MMKKGGETEGGCNNTQKLRNFIQRGAQIGLAQQKLC